MTNIVMKRSDDDPTTIGLYALVPIGLR